MTSVFEHTHRFQGFFHARVISSRSTPKFFGAEGHVLFNYCGNYLIVGILKSKTHRPPDVEHIPLVGRESPSTVTVPSSGNIMPFKRRERVDFPEPL